MGADINGKAFTMRFVFSYFESRKFESQLKNKATVDAYRVCFMNFRIRQSVMADGIFIYILAWASALLVQL